MRTKKIKLAIALGILIILVLFFVPVKDSNNPERPAQSVIIKVFGDSNRQESTYWNPDLLDAAALAVPEHFRPLEARAGESVQGEYGTILVEPEATKVRFTLTPLSSRAERGDPGVASSATSPRNDNRNDWTELTLLTENTNLAYNLYDGLVRHTLTLNSPQTDLEFEFKLVTSDGLELGDASYGYIPVYKKISVLASEQSERGNPGIASSALQSSALQPPRNDNKEMLMMLPIPQGVGANNTRVDYKYELTTNDKQLAANEHIIKLIPARASQFAKAVYPIKIHSDLQATVWHEALVKVGENGPEAGNAKDGDIVAIKPPGWHWGREERRRFVIVRVPKLSQSEQDEYTRRGVNVLASEQSERGNPGIASSRQIGTRNDDLSGAISYGVDYTKLVNPDELALIRDPQTVSPILDALHLPLEELFMEKPWSVALKNKGIEKIIVDNLDNKKTAKDSGSSAFQPSTVELELSPKDSIARLDILSSDYQKRAAGGGICTLGSLGDNPSSHTRSPATPESLYPEAEQARYGAGQELTDQSVIPSENRLAYQSPPELLWFTKLARKISQPARAATIVTKTIGAGARDYSTIGAWETGVEGNLVSAGTIQKGELYNDGVFNESIVINGSTTGASNYLWLITPLGERHDGRAGTGVRIDHTHTTSGDYASVDIQDEYLRLEFIELDLTNVSGTDIKIGVLLNSALSDTSDIRLNQMLIHDITVDNDSAVKKAYGIYVQGGALTITNSFIFGIQNTSDFSSTSAVGIEIDEAGPTQNIYNNTIFDIEQSVGSFGTASGIQVNTGTVNIQNNVVLDVNAVIAGNSFTGIFNTESHNASSDATASGVGSMTNKTDYAKYFIDITNGSENLHLKRGADFVDAGTDLSAMFQGDIDGPDRFNRWDMGADEMVCDPDWWHCNWTKRRKITLDNSTQGTSHTNFPAAVLLNSSRINYANASTSDIRFVDADDISVLDHEVEDWNEYGATVATTTIWVKVPSIDTSGTDYIWMYYGAPEYATSSNATTTGVWDQNFYMVHHFNDIYDSSLNNLHGNNISAATTTPSNLSLDGAFDFNGSSSEITIASFDPPHTGTASFWIKIPSNITVTERVMGGHDQFETVFFGDNFIENNFFEGVGGGIKKVVANTALVAGNWYYISETWSLSGLTMEIFLNGISDNSASGMNLGDPGGPFTMTMGRRTGTSDYWTGQLDEVRFSSVIRSDDWIAFEYCNMNDSCNSYGEEEEQSITAGVKIR